jgi:hypothetical protein
METLQGKDEYFKCIRQFISLGLRVNQELMEHVHKSIRGSEDDIFTYYVTLSFLSEIHNTLDGILTLLNGHRLHPTFILSRTLLELSMQVAFLTKDSDTICAKSLCYKLYALDKIIKEIDSAVGRGESYNQNQLQKFKDSKQCLIDHINNLQDVHLSHLKGLIERDRYHCRFWYTLYQDRLGKIEQVANFVQQRELVSDVYGVLSRLSHGADSWREVERFGESWHMRPLDGVKYGYSLIYLIGSIFKCVCDSITAMYGSNKEIATEISNINVQQKELYGRMKSIDVTL